MTRLAGLVFGQNMAAMTWGGEGVKYEPEKWRSLSPRLGSSRFYDEAGMLLVKILLSKRVGMGWQLHSRFW